MLGGAVLDLGGDHVGGHARRRACPGPARPARPARGAATRGVRCGRRRPWGCRSHDQLNLPRFMAVRRRRRQSTAADVPPIPAVSARRRGGSRRSPPRSAATVPSRNASTSSAANATPARAVADAHGSPSPGGAVASCAASTGQIGSRSRRCSSRQLRHGEPPGRTSGPTSTVPSRTVSSSRGRPRQPQAPLGQRGRVPVADAHHEVDVVHPGRATGPHPGRACAHGAAGRDRPRDGPHVVGVQAADQDVRRRR